MIEKQILETYSKFKSGVKTAEALGISHKKVLQVITTHGIKPYNTNSGNTKHAKNVKFFEKPNILNSYWAGFIGADGHISQDGGLIITLNDKDEAHLERFKKDVGYSGIIRNYVGEMQSGVLFNYVRVSVYSRKICKDLEIHWNVTPNKTKTLVFPKLSDDLLFSYIVGYIDGDGSFAFAKGKFHSLTICGRYDFLVDLQIALAKLLNEPTEAFKIYADHSIYKLSISRKNVLEKLKEKFLKLQKEFPYMERKWNRLLQADLSKGRI